MKTAAEMRATNPKFTAQNVLTELEKSIEFANRHGQLEIRLSCATVHPDRFQWIGDWTNSVNSPIVEDIIRQLRDAGYKVTEFYEERQFVDIDIIISWAE